jgi:hypothetical protein
MCKILELQLPLILPSLPQEKLLEISSINVGTVELKITKSHNAPIPEMKLALKLSLKNSKPKPRNEDSEGGVVVEVVVVAVAMVHKQ